VEITKRVNSQYYWYDFVVRGQRYRGSTKETSKTAAYAKAAKLFTEIAEGKSYYKKAPALSEFADRFLAFVDNAKLADKSKAYLRNGWRLLQQKPIAGMRMDLISTEYIDALTFPGSAYNINCALKTLRRMMSLAQGWDQIAKVPTIKLAKEHGRSLLLTEEAERKLLPFSGPVLRDVVVLIRDTGMRPKKELFRMRVEDLDWNNRAIFVPDSKTPTGRRFIPMSNRVLDLLMVRCAGRREGWVFPAHSRSGHITTVDKQFRSARTQAGLPLGLKLYCGRHDFGTQMLQRTGNLALVMKVMGQTSTKAAMQYQHPDLEHIRAALNATHAAPVHDRVN
jgi:integrase